MARDVRDVSFREGVVLGSLVAVLGLLLVLASAGVIPTDDDAFHAPRWLPGGVGFAFAAVGIYLVYVGLRNRGVPPGERTLPPAPVVHAVALSVVLPMTLAAHWIAFGPGPRRFQGGITGSEAEGRIAFGVGAVILDVLLVAILLAFVRAVVTRWRGVDSPK